MNNESDTWNEEDVYKVREKRKPEPLSESKLDGEPDIEKLRKEIEPWLTALFQSEHLSLLIGSGLSSAACQIAGKQENGSMSKIEFSAFEKQIEDASEKSAMNSIRGKANIEDQIRVANDLIKGLEIYLINSNNENDKNQKTIQDKELKNELQKGLIQDIEELKNELQKGLVKFANHILLSEKSIVYSETKKEVAEYLINFLISFASRSATRERLNIFTTNYDRIIEYSAELAGIRLIDRFVGTINPIFRSSRLDVDMHYNPPGIRGEPRYLEGVARFTKLHGSLDWVMHDDVVKRISLPYGSDSIEKYAHTNNTLMIYPNSAKDRETSEYPYVELFRDLAAAVCRPNSTLVIYGYSLGDQHISRVIEDMLTIPSTHLVIISWSDEGDRIKKFYERVNRPAQISLLIGGHFGDLKILVDHYLPKPSIDRTTIKMADLLKARGIVEPEKPVVNSNPADSEP